MGLNLGANAFWYLAELLKSRVSQPSCQWPLYCPWMWWALRRTRDPLQAAAFWSLQRLELATDMCKRSGFTPLGNKIPDCKSGRSLLGFTLVELLTVVTIIVLLISILIPALQTVKRQANSVVCRSNLRQWGIYLSMYTESNKDRFFTLLPDEGCRFWWWQAGVFQWSVYEISQLRQELIFQARRQF